MIATSTYDDPAFATLRSPSQDATNMIDVLGDPAVGGFTVTALLNEPEHRLRRKIGQFLHGRSTDELVVVYLSCHGMLDARGRLYFVAHDTEKDHLRETALESSWLMEGLSECRARKQVLILDCCFSGSFANTKGPTDVDLERRLGGRGRAVLTASRASEYSYEGTHLDGPGGSVFTAALVEGLRTGDADQDEDGYISVEDAFTYAAARVNNQTPQKWLYGAEGDIILARNPRGMKVSTIPLPEALRMALESPYPRVRLGAVTELGDWLDSSDPDTAMAGQQALQRVASEDSPAVARTARELLHTMKSREPAGQDFSPVSTINTSKEAIFQIAFSPDTYVLACPDRFGVRLWDALTGQPLGQALAGDTAEGTAVTFSPDGRLLASAGIDAAVGLWDTATGRPIGHSLTGHTRTLTSVAFSPDGRMLASTSADATARLWDLATSKPIGDPLTGHGATAWTVAFSPEGRILASAGEGATVNLWDPTTSEPVGHLLAGPDTKAVPCVAFSPNGRIIAGGCSDSVQFWNTATGQSLGPPILHTSFVMGVAFNPTGQILASASFDGTVRLWDTTTHQQIGDPLDCGSPMMTVAFSSDGRVLAAADDKGTLQVWYSWDGFRKAHGSRAGELADL